MRNDALIFLRWGARVWPGKRSIFFHSSRPRIDGSATAFRESRVNSYHKWCGSITSGVGVLRVVLEVLHFLSPPTCTRIWTNMCWGILAGSDCVHTIWEWSLANGMVVLAFVINVSVEKFKMRSMYFSFASVLKCASCAWDTDLFEGMVKTLRAFAPSSSEFIPFLACHHSITDFEINAFLNQDSYRLLKFVSDLVSIFNTGWFCFTSQLPSARDSGCRPSL